MPPGIQGISRKMLSCVLAICLVLATVVSGIVSQAWAEDVGIYAFICQKGDDGDYVLVVKNGFDAPAAGEYGTVIKSYPQNLADTTKFNAMTTSYLKGWPWIATAGTGTSNPAVLDGEAQAVKKVVVAGADGSVSLSYAKGMFSNFSKCTVFDLRGFHAQGYKGNGDANFSSLIYNVYNATTNNDVAVILGTENLLVDTGLIGPSLYYREYQGAYSIVGVTIPTGAGTYYTKKPSDCLVSGSMTDYEVNLLNLLDPSNLSLVFDGTSLLPTDVQVTMKDYPSIEAPSTAYTLYFSKYNSSTEEWDHRNANLERAGIGHYRVQVTGKSPYSGDTAWVEFYVTPGGTLKLYSDASLQSPVASEGLSLTGATDLYVKCVTALSGLDGTNEMKVFAASSNSAVLRVDAPVKVGGYKDGYCVYKVTLNPVAVGAVDVSIWGYTGTNTTVGTLTTVLPTSTDIQPATLTLGVGAQDVLNDLVVLGDTVVVDLTYQGRDPETVNSDEIIIRNPNWLDTQSYKNPELSLDTALASYDITTGKLSVTPQYIGASGKLQVTVPGMDLYGEAFIEINVNVRQITPTATLTLGGAALPQPLGFTPEQAMQIALAYSGEDMLIGTLGTTNSAVAEITAYSVNPDRRGAMLTAQARAASTSSVTLSLRVSSARMEDVSHSGAVHSIYKAIDVSFTGKVSRTELALGVTPSALKLKAGETGTAQVSNDAGRAITVASSDASVATATFDRETMQLSVEALAPGTATLTLSAAETNTHNASKATVQVTVTAADRLLVVTPDELGFKAGEVGTASVSYEGDGAVTVASSDEGVATATYDEGMKTLSVEALAPGVATITVSAAATEASEAAEAAVQVTVTAADGALTVSPNELEIKAGETGTASVSYEGDGAVTAASSNEDVATAAYDEDMKKLSVQALAVGTATITVSAAATEASEAAEATVQVTVTTDAPGGKEDAPPLGIGTQYVLVVGDGPWTVEYSEALHYTLAPLGIIEATPSSDGKKLTVNARAKGSAVLTLWADETATTLALAPVSVSFTVNEPPPPVKPVRELPALSLQVGAKATSTIALLDANNNAIAGAITITGADAQVAKVSYDPATKELTIIAAGPGQTVIGLSSEAAAEDYTMKVTVRAVVTPAPVVDAGGTGAEVTGTLKNVPEGAAVKVNVKAVASGTAYDSLVAAATKAGDDTLSVREVTLTIDGTEVHDGFGTLTIALPVAATLEGSEVTVWHLHLDGRITSERVKAAGGMATVKATDLSTFAVTVAGTPSTTTGTTTTTPGTGSLVTSGTTGSTTTSGTGSLVTSSGGTGSSSTAGTLGTSQSSAQDAKDTNALDDEGDGTAALASASTPLASSSAFEADGADGADGTSQASGMDPRVLAASAAVVLAAGLWFFLRRRKRAALAEMEYLDEPRAQEMDRAASTA